MFCDSETGTVWVLLSTFSGSEALDEAAGEQAGLSRPLQSAFVPAVLPLLVDKHHVALPQLDLRLALGRVGHHHTIPVAHRDRYNTCKAVGGNTRRYGSTERMYSGVNHDETETLIWLFHSY